jgi:hypothetical protein
MSCCVANRWCHCQHRRRPRSGGHLQTSREGGKPQESLVEETSSAMSGERRHARINAALFNSRFILRGFDIGWFPLFALSGTWRRARPAAEVGIVGAKNTTDRWSDVSYFDGICAVLGRSCGRYDGLDASRVCSACNGRLRQKVWTSCFKLVRAKAENFSFDSCILWYRNRSAVKAAES